MLDKENKIKESVWIFFQVFFEHMSQKSKVLFVLLRLVLKTFFLNFST